MTSPLEIRLTAQADASSDPDVRAGLSAEVACYLSRVGQFDEAEKIRVQLREVYGDGRSVQVSILLMMLDSLILFFRDLSPSARDRMARANLIAVASGSQRWTSLTSAWLAHIDFNFYQFQKMALEISAAIGAIKGDDGTAECRVALVLGDAFLFCGQTKPSQAWYERARVTGNRLGDQAAVGALTYNRAALRVSLARLGLVQGSSNSADVAGAWAEVKSASNYQVVARTKSLDHLIEAAKVGALVLQQNYMQALSAITNILSIGSVPAASSELLLLHADRSLCLAATGDRLGAIDQISQIEEPLIASLRPDDAALVYWSMAQASRHLGGEEEAERLLALAKEGLRQHEMIIDELKARIEKFADPNCIAG
jgi:hypothetical protein